MRRVSLESDGTQLDAAGAGAGSISRDGRYASFTTDERATPDDLDSSADVFVRDLVAGTTTRVSIAPPSSPDPLLWSGRLSPNGRYAVVVGLVGPSTSLTVVRDLVAGTSTLVSTELVLKAEVSDDGNVVAVLRALPAGTGTSAQYVVHDLAAATVTVVETVSHHTSTWAGCCLSLDLSPDGRHLVHSVTNVDTWLEVLDRETGTSRRLPSDPTPGDPLLVFVDRLASISDDGRFVAYERSVSNQLDDARAALVVHDAVTGDVSVVHTMPEGELWTINLPAMALSGDGRYVAFASTEPGLVVGDTDATSSVFVRFARQPRISTASPSTVGRGTATTVTLTGEWLLGDPDLVVEGGGVTVTDVEVVGPHEVRATITVAPDAPATRRLVTAILDGSWPGRRVDGGTGGGCACLTVTA